MYYDLSQKEYKEYSKKFKKTFIGKSRFRDFIGCTIIGTIFLLFFTSYLIMGVINIIDVEINFYSLTIILLTIIFMILEVVTRMMYDMALKEYINNKK